MRPKTSAQYMKEKVRYV